MVQVGPIRIQQVPGESSKNTAGSRWNPVKVLQESSKSPARIQQRSSSTQRDPEDSKRIRQESRRVQEEFVREFGGVKKSVPENVEEKVGRQERANRIGTSVINGQPEEIRERFVCQNNQSFGNYFRRKKKVQCDSCDRTARNSPRRRSIVIFSSFGSQSALYPYASRPQQISQLSSFFGKQFILSSSQASAWTTARTKTHTKTHTKTRTKTPTKTHTKTPTKIHLHSEGEREGGMHTGVTARGPITAQSANKSEQVPCRRFAVNDMPVETGRRRRLLQYRFVATKRALQQYHCYNTALQSTGTLSISRRNINKCRFMRFMCGDSYDGFMRQVYTVIRPFMLQVRKKIHMRIQNSYVDSCGRFCRFINKFIRRFIANSQ